MGCSSGTVGTNPSALHSGAGIPWGALRCELCSQSKAGIQPKVWGVSKPKSPAQKSLSMEELGGEFFCPSQVGLYQGGGSSEDSNKATVNLYL